MTIMARFSGTCPECDGRWQPGDLIRAEEDQVWRHACCPGPYDRITVGAVTSERLAAPAEVTRAADDDADHVASVFTRAAENLAVAREAMLARIRTRDPEWMPGDREEDA